MAKTEGTTTYTKGEQSWEASNAVSRGTYSGFVTLSIVAMVLISLILIGMAIFLA